MTTNREAAEQAASILDGQDCPHETPGGAPMCALCREAVLRQHEGYERIKGRRHGLPVPRTHVPMPDYVRRGLLSIKEHRTEIEELIPQNYNFSFSSQGVHAQRLESADIKDNLYQYINSRTSELLQRGIPAADVNDLIVLDINNAFSHYSGGLARRVVNKSQLAKLVDDRLIRLVEAFLQQAEQLGKKAVNGMFMLVAQAVAAEEIWLQREISNDVILKVAAEMEKQL